jgi:farnesyl-diphosphate farnesyltransferase
LIAGELDFAALQDSLRDFAVQQTDPHERKLIENLRGCFDWLARLDPADRADIREVLKTIVSGQRLDLERFGDPSVVKSIQTAAQLEEYTYLVAGCVGDFWTKLGFRRLPPFGTAVPEEMTKLGIAYGKGLQLINILRDRHADLANGRDYLPAEELATAPLDEVFARWLRRAEEQIGAGIDYSSHLINWRVRFATALPALIGARTLALLRVAGPGKPRVKVPRHEVRGILWQGLRATAARAALRPLFARLLAPPR